MPARPSIQRPAGGSPAVPAASPAKVRAPAPAEGAPAPSPPAPADPSAPKIHPKYQIHGTVAQAAQAAEPEDPRAASARAVLGLYLKAARASQLYPRQSKIRRDVVTDFSGALVKHLADHGETALDVRQSEIRAFGAPVYDEPDRQKSLAFRLFGNGVRTVTFLPGLEPAEAEGVVDVLTIAFRADAGAEEIQAAVWERSFSHATFEVNEESLGEGESEEFDGFLQETEPDHVSAEGARDAAADAWDALAAAPRAASPFRAPAESDAARLAARVAAEDARDLLAEVSDLLLESLRGGDAESVRGTLEAFFEHLVTSGDVLRAARSLASLRAISVETRDRATARALADVVDRIGRARIVPALAPLAECLTEADREGFTMLLAALGECAVAPLCQMLGTPAHGLAVSALDSLAPRYLRLLEPFVEDTNPEIAKAVLGLMVRHAAPDSLACLFPALRHPDSGVRREALRAVVAAGGPQATELLLGVLDDPVYEVRAVALDALGTARDPRAVRPLLLRLEKAGATGSSYERRELFRAVGRIGGPEATAALVRILGTTSLFRREQFDEARCLAAAALALVGNAGARAALTKFAGDRSAPVKQAVQAALREIESRAAPPGSPLARNAPPRHV